MAGITRSNQLARRSFWLLEFDLGGRPWRFSTEDLEILAESGERVTFASGLGSVNLELEVDSAQVEVRAQEENTWARSRRRLGPLTGRRFTLRRWVEGWTLDRAVVYLQGVIAEAGYGSVGDPALLTLNLERALLELSSEVPSSTGQYYPVILGYPGTDGTDNPAVMSPAFPVDATSLGPAILWRYLIAGHRVAAANIQKRLLQDGTIYTASTAAVFHDVDNLGRTYAYVFIDGNDIPHADGNEVLIGWADEVGGAAGAVVSGGPGLRFQGDPVLGLGDVLIWGAATWMAPVVVDWAELRNRRDALNRFKIDTVINDPVKWLQWLEAEVYDLFQIEEVNGPRGLYWREIVYDADPKDVRARLTTEPGGRGFQVERSSTISDSEDEILNQISIQYSARYMSTSSFRDRRTLGPDPTALVGGNAVLGGAQDDRTIQNIRCLRSFQDNGLRAKLFQSVLVCQESTAVAILEGKVSKHALAAQVVEYTGGYELADLRKYDTVEIEDTRGGADFQEGTLAVVTRIVIEDQGTFRAQLRIPEDPIRDPGTN